MTKNERIRKMRRALLSWFHKSGRDLPWRQTNDPYRILVSEVMLQQTQVSRVIPKYDAFLAMFPNWQTLAAAKQSDVVRMWDGLGYNRRAMMLHKLAMTVAAQTTPDPSFERRGGLPVTHEELVKLPGIGDYTAEAVRAFAFRAAGAAPVDTNIERILKRVFGAHQKDRKEIQSLAHDVVPKDTWSWNHAMMDLGATVCTARAPSCASCPLQSVCDSYPCAGNDVKKRPQAKFADSDRMYRGRIIAVLRGKPQEVGDLQRAVRLEDEERFGRLVDSLISEGLVAMKRGKLTLV